MAHQRCVFGVCCYDFQPGLSLGVIIYVIICRISLSVKMHIIY